jgi:hypothetical protein
LLESETNLTIFSLISAEAKAEEKKLGIWANEASDRTVRVNELQGDAARSKQFLPYLQRSNRVDCVVEFVGKCFGWCGFVEKMCNSNLTKTI